MMNFNNSNVKIRWSVVGGVVLLFFAFFVIILSNNDSKPTVAEPASEATTASLKETTASSVVEETTSAQELINFDAPLPYLVRVNRAQNFVIVYGIDYEGRYTIPYKIFICSTGIEEGSTPLGIYEISDKYRWRIMIDGTYAQYAVRIFEQIMFHSIPYNSPKSNTMFYKEYNKLGTAASHGCIRLQAADVAWIYKNCKAGTKVNIYEDAEEIPPMTIPSITKIKKSDPRKNWDPTDPLKKNPWKKTDN